MKRALLALAMLTAATSCGQTGSLYLPDEQIETPVESRTTAPPASTVPAPDVDDKKEDNSAEPPGR